MRLSLFELRQPLPGPLSRLFLLLVHQEMASRVIANRKAGHFTWCGKRLPYPIDVEAATKVDAGEDKDRMLEKRQEAFRVYFNLARYDRRRKVIMDIARCACSVLLYHVAKSLVSY